MFESLRGGLDVGAEDARHRDDPRGGPGRHLLRRAHTLEHFREWVFMSPLFRSQAYPTWEKQGAAETPELATYEWSACSRARRIRASTTPSRQELREYMAERKRVLDE